MKIGYARISTSGQSLDMQIDALKKAGCEKIFNEVASGAKSDRPELNRLLEQLREGDVVVIWKLDRICRSLKHLITLISELTEKGVGLQSLNDPIDTTTPQGRLVLNIFGCLAEFERELILERTLSGLEAARARGRRGGRKPGLSLEAQKTALMAVTLYKERKLTVAEICSNLRICRASLYKYIKAYKEIRT